MRKRAMDAAEIGAEVEATHDLAIALDELLSSERMPPRRALTRLSGRVRDRLQVLEQATARAAEDQWREDSSGVASLVSDPSRSSSSKVFPG